MTQFNQVRMKICEDCEHLTTLKFCSKCNCFMPVKTTFPGKKCPLDKWDRIVMESSEKDK